MKRGLQKDTQKVWTLGHFFPKKNSIPFLHKMVIAKVFQSFCGWFRVSFLPLLCLTSQTIQCDGSHCCECMHCLLTLTFLKALYMHLVIWGSAICGLARSSSCGSLTAYKLSNIQTLSNIQRRQMRLRKNVNCCLLTFIISLTFWKPLGPTKEDNRIKITVSVINKHGNLNKSCIDHNIYFIWTSP